MNTILDTPVSSPRHLVISDTLRRCQLFSRLDVDSIAELATSCRLKSLEKGNILFREGEKAVGFYIVQSGTISLSRVSREGKEQVISLFRPYDCFAEATLSDFETYPANATALESCQVVLVSKDSFRSFLATRPDLAMSMLASMSIHLKNLIQMIEDLKFKQIECRLASWLLRQCGDKINTLTLSFSKKVLASRLGVTSETLSRAFGRFRSEELISVESRTITILDRNGIEGYIQEA